MRRKHRSRKGEKTQITPCDDFETSRKLWRGLTVLSLDRKLTSHGTITCGGTEAVVFKTWNQFFSSNENISMNITSS